MATSATRRLYYNDSFQRTFDARALSCEPVSANAIAGIVPPAWGVILDATAFYPASGGQPCDLGKLGEAKVLAVIEEGHEILHVVNGCLKSGPVSGCIDWDRRFDHMQQHTGQHLLSGVLQERFGLPTVSFHLGTEVCTIDLRGPEPPEEILDGAERAANQVVCENRSVTVRYATARQLVEMGVRKQVEREGILRVIEIEGIDLQPCGGTHVRQTGQIGPILLRRVSKIRQDWRLEFVCGPRAVKQSRAEHRLLMSASAALGCSAEEIPASAARVLSERDARHKAVRVLAGRLAEGEAVLAMQNAQPGADGVRVVTRVIEGIEPEYLARFASEIAKHERTVVLAGRVECGHLIFAQHASVGRDLAALLKAVLEKVPGKGGGTHDFVRAKITDPQAVRQAIELGANLLLSVRAAE